MFSRLLVILSILFFTFTEHIFYSHTEVHAQNSLSPISLGEKNKIIKEFTDLRQSVNSSNWENKKLELSNLLFKTKDKYPHLKLEDYFFLTDDKLNGIPADSIPSEHSSQFRNLVSFMPEGILRLALSYHREDPNSSQNSRLIYSLGNISDLFWKYVFSNRGNLAETVFLALPGDQKTVHFSLITARWNENEFLEVGIIDSMGFELERKDAETTLYANNYAQEIVNSSYLYGKATGQSFYGKIKFFVTARKRQSDQVSCPLFVLRDYVTYGINGFMNYRDALEDFRKQQFSPSTTIGPLIALKDYAEIYSLPEHPQSLAIMQSSSVLDFLAIDALIPHFVSNTEVFLSSVRGNFWPSKALGGKKVNVIAQRDLFDHVIRLMTELLNL